jgi:hypothetical protein
MLTRRPPAWMLVAGTVAAVVGALLLARPAAAGLAMMIFIMAGLPALYRLRRYARAPRGVDPDRLLDARADVRRSVRDGHSGDGTSPGPAWAAGRVLPSRTGTRSVTRHEALSADDGVTVINQSQPRVGVK